MVTFLFLFKTINNVNNGLQSHLVACDPWSLESNVILFTEHSADKKQTYFS